MNEETLRRLVAQRMIYRFPPVRRRPKLWPWALAGVLFALTVVTVLMIFGGGR